MLPVGVIPVTAVVTEVTYGPRELARVHFRNGSTREAPLDQTGAFISEKENPENTRQVDLITVELPALARFSRLAVCGYAGPGERPYPGASVMLGYVAASAGGVGMLQKGTAKKVTIYINEDTQHHFSSLCDALLTFLLHKGVSGATATRAMTGFGAHQVTHTTKIEVLAEHLPIRIEFIESVEKVDELMPTLYDMVNDGVIEVQDTQVIKAANKERRPPPQGPHTEMRGTARLMRIYMGESDRWQGEPLHEAIVKRLRLMDIAGATVYRGIEGYGASTLIRRSHLLSISHDAPVMVSVVDTEEKIQQLLPALDEMVVEGLIAMSNVEVIKYMHEAAAAARS